MTPLFAVIITFGLIFTILATLAQGLSFSRQSPESPFKDRSQSLVMLLLAKLIIYPVLLIGMTVVLPFTPDIKMGVAVCALAAGAPFIPWVVSLGKGNIPYAGGVSLLLTVIMFIFLSLTLPFVLSILGTGVTISIWRVAWPLILFMVIPLLFGMVVRSRYPKLAAEIAPYIGPIAISALLVHITLFIVYTWNDVTSLFLTGLLVFSLAMPILGLLIGYLLNPPYVLSPIPATNPQRDTKIVAMVSTSLSNTGATILCAIFSLGAYTLAGDAILVIGLVSIFVTALTMAELGKRYETKGGS